MNTTNIISSFLDSFVILNRFGFGYNLKSDSCCAEFTLSFENPVHCALMYSLLHEMLIENTSIYLDNSKEIRILVCEL